MSKELRNRLLNLVLVQSFREKRFALRTTVGAVGGGEQVSCVTTDKSSDIDIPISGTAIPEASSIDMSSSSAIEKYIAKYLI